ncbi:hypothetical protein V6N13_140406 [Hibiscus sabdariffa]
MSMEAMLSGLWNSCSHHAPEPSRQQQPASMVRLSWLLNSGTVLNTKTPVFTMEAAMAIIERQRLLKKKRGCWSFGSSGNAATLTAVGAVGPSTGV